MNTLTISQLNTRANAEGLNFNTIKTAIIECGESLKTRGYTYGPFEIALTSLPRFGGLYRDMVKEAAPGVQPWEEVTASFPEPAWAAVYKFHLQSKWVAMKSGGTFTVENDTTKWWCRKLDNDTVVIDTIYDSREEEWEQEQYMFLPSGIRAAVAAKIGADFSSSTFHAAFDAIVDGYAIY